MCGDVVQTRWALTTFGIEFLPRLTASDTARDLDKKASTSLIGHTFDIREQYGQLRYISLIALMLCCIPRNWSKDKHSQHQREPAVIECCYIPSTHLCPKIAYTSITVATVRHILLYAPNGPAGDQYVVPEYLHCQCHSR